MQPSSSSLGSALSKARSSRKYFACKSMSCLICLSRVFSQTSRNTRRSAPILLDPSAPPDEVASLDPSGVPVPRERMKSGSSAKGKPAATSACARPTGSFSRRPASWSRPTPLTYLGGKKLSSDQKGKIEETLYTHNGAAEVALALFVGQHRCQYVTERKPTSPKPELFRILPPALLLDLRCSSALGPESRTGKYHYLVRSRRYH